MKQRRSWVSLQLALKGIEHEIGALKRSGII